MQLVGFVGGIPGFLVGVPGFRWCSGFGGRSGFFFVPGCYVAPKNITCQ